MIRQFNKLMKEIFLPDNTVEPFPISPLITSRSSLHQDPTRSYKILYDSKKLPSVFSDMIRQFNKLMKEMFVPDNTVELFPISPLITSRSSLHQDPTRSYKILYDSKKLSSVFSDMIRQFNKLIKEMFVPDNTVEPFPISPLITSRSSPHQDPTTAR